MMSNDSPDAQIDLQACALRQGACAGRWFGKAWAQDLAGSLAVHAMMHEEGKPMLRDAGRTRGLCRTTGF